jgi:hypothetical protein
MKWELTARVARYLVADPAGVDPAFGDALAHGRGR